MKISSLFLAGHYWSKPKHQVQQVEHALGVAGVRRETQTSTERLTFTSQVLCLTSCFFNESQLPATSAFNFIPAWKNMKVSALNMSRSLCTPRAELARSSALQSMVPVIIKGGNELLALEHTHTHTHTHTRTHRGRQDEIPHIHYINIVVCWAMCWLCF